MSHRRAKRIRQALFPADKRARLSRTRVSAGRFLRATTDYERKASGIRYIPWPLQVLWGKIPMQMYVVRLKQGTPRQVYRRVKRRVNRGNALAN